MHSVIDVAGITISFHGSDADAAMIDARYGPFLIDSLQSGDSRISLSLRDAPDEVGTSFDLELRPNGDDFTLECPEFRARVSKDGSHAEIAAPRLERYVDAVVRYVLSRQLLDRGGLLLHASAVVREGTAWVFAGPSGVGKTTISQRLPGRVLGDEAIALTCEDGTLVCHATPYWQALPDSAPVAGLLFPEQGATNEWIELSRARSLAKLMSCTGPLLPGSESQVMVAAEHFVSTGTTHLASIRLESVEAIAEWLHPHIAGLPAPRALVE